MTTTILNDAPTVQAKIGDRPEQPADSPMIPSRYEVLSQVGTGGMGIVYKVRDLETQDIIALKILKAGIAADPAMQESLRREVSLARKVTHKNVCRIHEFIRFNGTACISMEFFEGESLLARLQRDGRLPWMQAFQIAVQICAGLREAHAQGIVHSDLKPANIMVDDNGGVKIMDFGIARLFQGTSQMTGTLVGTPAYMAPEQVELKRVDARTDVYALGLLLYEIVTGLPAFHGETPIAVALKQLREFPQRPREIVASLPAGGEALILKCLQKNPEKRFQSVDELAAALQKAMAPKPSVSLWASFTTDFCRAWRELRESLQPAADAAVHFLRSRNWKALRSKRAQKLLGTGLAAACLVGGVAILSGRSSHKKQAAAAPMASATAAMMVQTPVAPAFPPALPSPRGASPISAFAVDLSKTGAAPDSASDSPIVASRQERKAQAPARTAKTSPLTMQRKPAPQPVAASPALVASVPTAGTPAANEPKTEDAASDLSAEVHPAVPAATPAETAKEDKTGDETFAAARYLEVGSFKDSTWADHAVEQLTEFGFRAASVHKRSLWMQSYQVRVGPYMDSQELTAAQEDLVSRGFKPHAVK